MIGVDDLLRELDDIPQTSQGAATGPKGRRLKASAHTTTKQQGQDAFTQGSSQCSSSSTLGTGVSNTARPLLNSSSLISERQQASKAFISHSANVSRTSIDLLLDDFDLPNDSACLHSGRDGRQATASSSSKLLKCIGLNLGGTQYQRGRNGAAVGTISCCDSIRCTKCDFRVMTFPNKEWSRDVDYLFFRNNYPTDSKLACKLLGLPSSIAYCCQCSWLSTIKAEKVDFSSDLRWTCAGHSS